MGTTCVGAADFDSCSSAIQQGNKLVVELNKTDEQIISQKGRIESCVK